MSGIYASLNRRNHRQQITAERTDEIGARSLTSALAGLVNCRSSARRMRSLVQRASCSHGQALDVFSRDRVDWPSHAGGGHSYAANARSWPISDRVASQKRPFSETNPRPSAFGKSRP